MFENRLLIQSWRLTFDEIELVKGGRGKGGKDGSSSVSVTGHILLIYISMNKTTVLVC